MKFAYFEICSWSQNLYLLEEKYNQTVPRGGVVAKPGIATGSRSNIRAVTRERNPWIKGSNGHEFFIPEHIPSAPPTLDVDA
jgi:hypothetical protein